MQYRTFHLVVVVGVHGSEYKSGAYTYSTQGSFHPSPPKNAPDGCARQFTCPTTRIGPRTPCVPALIARGPHDQSEGRFPVLDGTEECVARVCLKRGHRMRPCVREQCHTQHCSSKTTIIALTGEWRNAATRDSAGHQCHAIRTPSKVGFLARSWPTPLVGSRAFG